MEEQDMIRAVIYDAGNVLVFYEILNICKRLSRLSGKHSPEEIKGMIFGGLGGPEWGPEFLSYHFDIGWIDTNEFLQKLREKLGIHSPPLGPADEILKQAFNYCFALDGEIRRLIWFLADEEKCPRKITQGIVSNINELQWGFALSALPTLRLKTDEERPGAMDFHVLSFREKIVKPTREIYTIGFFEAWMAHLRKTAGDSLKLHECLYLDDRPENIPPAREIGFHAERVESYGPQTLFPILGRYGVPLPPADYIPKPDREYLKRSKERCYRKDSPILSAGNYGAVS